MNKGRREYVKLLRAYHKANPGKSLKVDLQLVKQQLKPSENANGSNGTPGGQSGPRPAVNYMATVASVLGAEVTGEMHVKAFSAAKLSATALRLRAKARGHVLLIAYAVPTMCK